MSLGISTLLKPFSWVCFFIHQMKRAREAELSETALSVLMDYTHAAAMTRAFFEHIETLFWEEVQLKSHATYFELTNPKVTFTWDEERENDYDGDLKAQCEDGTPEPVLTQFFKNHATFEREDFLAAMNYFVNHRETELRVFNSQMFGIKAGRIGPSTQFVWKEGMK
jgi:hypothetical protein